jgi:hypothetical protein
MVETLRVSRPCVQQIGHAAYADHWPLAGEGSSKLSAPMGFEIVTVTREEFLDCRQASAVIGLSHAAK